MISTGLFIFLTRAAAIATGSPEVVARRVVFMSSPAAWGFAGASEVQTMFIEKAEATMESSAALFRQAQPASLLEWFFPGDVILRMANAMMKPTAQRVGANVDRLRAF